MTKYKVTYYPSSDRDNNQVVGTYADKTKAAEEGYNYASKVGALASCDKKKEIVEALLSRDYYMLAYGPRELEIEEVVS